MSSKLIDIEAERRNRVQRDAIPRTRRHRRELVMDIVEDRRRPMFYCIVQRQGSPEILMLGQFSSRPDAVHAGEQFMSDYLRRERDATGNAA